MICDFRVRIKFLISLSLSLEYYVCIGFAKMLMVSEDLKFFFFILWKKDIRHFATHLLFRLWRQIKMKNHSFCLDCLYRYQSETFKMSHTVGGKDVFAHVPRYCVHLRAQWRNQSLGPEASNLSILIGLCLYIYTIYICI